MEPLAASADHAATSWLPPVKPGKKRKRLQKKAPGAPKRGKSPYILFSMEKRDEIKATLEPDAKVTDIMRAIADAWAKMADEDKQPWKIAAEQDKQRYEEEMASYDGPLRVPNKRAKKHPDAPKRASSAFLFYSQVMRSRIKSENPDMKNTDISKQLGEAWSKATESQKAPFVEKEREDRARYKREMEEWNQTKADREFAESQHYASYASMTGFDSMGYAGSYSTTEV
jgi:high mobility group protein B2